MTQNNDKKTLDLSLRSLDEQVELGKALKELPFWNLYHYLNSGREGLFPQILPLLDEKQRQRIFDLENWTKDDFSINRYEFWLSEVVKSQNLDLFKDFVSKIDYKLFLKSKFQISTFDLEFPEYPDHDHFFLTDDNSFLIEYDEDFELADELRLSLRIFYGVKGVTVAYENLLDLISESFFTLQERLYTEKTFRLSEMGVLDYFESLKLLKSFGSIEKLDKYISKQMNKKVERIYLDSDDVFEKIDSRISLFDQDENSLLFLEYSLVRDPIVKKHFSFYLSQTVNSVLHLDGKLSGSSQVVKAKSLEIAHSINLAISFIRNNYSKEEFQMSVLERFAISELYNVGINLVSLRKKFLNKVLKDNFDESTLYFIGEKLNLFLEDFLDQSRVRINNNLTEINSIEALGIIDRNSKFLSDHLQVMKDSHTKMMSLSDFESLNYEKDEVDFEVILINQFIAKLIELDFGNKIPQFTQDELESFLTRFNSSDINQKVESFCEEIEAPSLKNFLSEVLCEHFDGLVTKDLEREDLKHLSGIIIKS